jgi:hypothetical protein
MRTESQQEETVIAKELLGKHAPVAMVMHATTDTLLEVVFSGWPVPRIYNVGQQEIPGGTTGLSCS